MTRVRPTRIRAAGIAALVALSLLASLARADAPHVLDRFDDASAWTASGSDEVSATLRRETGADGNALCLAFDFHGVSGYATMRRPLAIDVPDNYAFSFRVRGDAPDNALQFKLADASGDNVWWVNRPDFSFTRAWKEQKYRKRDVDFAWGPMKDRTLRHTDAVEFTIYAGKGGRGEVCFDRFALTALPPDPTAWPAPVARASSALRDAPAAFAVDADPATAWRSNPRRGDEQDLVLDFGAAREFGGLVLHWQGAAFASRYDVDASDDGTHWRTLRRVVDGNGGSDPLYLPGSQSRYVRLALHDGPQHAYALGAIDVKSLDFGASANAFFSDLARASPRGWYPRGFYDEQTYWTIVGTDGGHETGLLSEDGALEVARGGFSVEPFLIDAAGAITSWADVKIGHSLQDRYLPIPSVLWQRDGMRLTTTALAAGTPAASQIVATYTVSNESDRPLEQTLALAVRPFQVNPSRQFLNTPGGVSPIHDLAWSGRSVSVDGKARVHALEVPSAFAARSFDGGMIVADLSALATSTSPAASSAPAHLHDDTGLASGALLYRVELAPHASRTIALAIPLDGNPAAPALDTDGAWSSAQRAAAADDWRRRLGGVELRVPSAAQPLADALRTALAHILISRDGPSIRPGTRSYARSWIRDGAMMSDALLRLGREDVARDYLEWYAPHQFKSGKVPCCVDQRGADPVAENDSHGELIHLVDQVWRYGRDRDLLQRMWPHVEAGARYMDTLRASERTPANQVGERRAFYGMMPASISHEGYSAKPMHSYWDDFWALTGYRNAVDIAHALQRPDDVARLSRSRDEFAGDLLTSIRTAVAAHAIDFIPGSAELGDFDATSTTIVFSPTGEQDRLPQDLVRNTFERYWSNFVARRDSATWKDYTPYEWRMVGAFVRLGWRDRALQAIDFFMHDRRPPEWNQWAEVIGRDPRESRFIGDMPHGWVASDFIRSVLDMFAYERESDHAIVLAAGVPDTWLAGDGIALQHLRTPYGEIGFRLRRDDDALYLRLEGDPARAPPGGFLVAADSNSPTDRATLDGRKIRPQHGYYRIDKAPADFVLHAH